MQSFVSRTDGSPRVGRLFGLDALFVTLLSALVVLHAVPLFPAVLIGYPALLTANVIIIWHARRHVSREAMNGRGVRKWEWCAIAVFTIASLAAFMDMIQEPSVQSALQALISALPAVYLWLVAYHLSRAKRLGKE